MTKYKNGRIPKDKLVYLGGEHWLPQATLDKWNSLVSDVKAREGVTLRITQGPNAYRDYESQVEMKLEYGKGAAAPGFSSHGGTFNGKDAMAIDVANYQAIGQTKFFEYARKHGFEPNYFHGQNGSKKEPWHIIDWEPWRAVTPPAPTPTPEPEEEEEEDMPKNSGVWYRKDTSTYVYLVFNTGSGFAHEFSNGKNAGAMPGSYTAGLKVSMDISGWSEVTLGHANVIKKACVEVRPQGAPSEIEVTIVTPEELEALDG